MARRSAKRIVLDELAALHCATLTAYEAEADCNESTNAAYAHMIKRYSQKVTDKRNEAARIAELLGATADEILQAYKDGETLHISQT